MSKILLYPFSVLYGLITATRNWLYDKQVFKSVRFDFPVIGIGNLTAGGTGKTPHTEYLIFLLQYVYRVATLSRGYGRSSHGFQLADANSTAAQLGDEPRQFKMKFPETIVAVGEDRVLAVPRILGAHPETDVLLLDDAFQHRGIRPGLSVLLTEYNNLFTRDSMMPVGWLREYAGNYHRADLIVVTKCPATLSQQEKASIVSEIKPFNYQRVYFSTIEYGPLYSFYDPRYRAKLVKDVTVLLVCGIARYEPLLAHLKAEAANVYVREFDDHHRYDKFDLDSIRQTLHNLGDIKKVIITTEKDMARLEEHRDWFLQNKIEIFVQPIAVRFLAEDGERFNADILKYVEATRQKTGI